MAMGPGVKLYKRQSQSAVSVASGYMAVASAEIPPEDERGGDVIRLAGMSIGPDIPLLAGHVHTGPAGQPSIIGRCLSFERGTIPWGTATVPALFAAWEWADTELAMQYRTLWERGFLNCVSVGILVKDVAPLSKSDPLGGWDIKSSELLELSVVAVPANPAARRLMKDMGITPDDDNNRMDDIVVAIRELGRTVNRRLDDIESTLSVLADDSRQPHAPQAATDSDLVAKLRGLLNSMHHKR